jgi:hypothetical protein
MKQPPPQTRNSIQLILPDHWSPEQAWAVFELLDDLREAIWKQYGPQIQEAIREDRTPHPDPPF